MGSDLQLAKPLTLPCGLTLPNRVVKAAMAENLADKKHLPGEDVLRVYREWAEGGWGMMLTGNIQVQTTYLGGPGDMAIPDASVVPEEKVIDAYRALNAVAASQGAGTPLIAQLNHPGRQAPGMAGTRSFFAKNIAPSPIPIQLGGGGASQASSPLLPRMISKLMFGTPREMTHDDIAEVVAQFARATRIMAEAGLAGVQIHGAHGYLATQFLSARTNQRTDEYGGTARKRARFVVEILRAVREAVPSAKYKGFCIGIKLNSVDHQSEQELGDCVEQIEAIVEAGVDFIEISGGSYEDPQMVKGPSSSPQREVRESTKKREAFFLEFAKAIRSRFPDVPLMVTGGFRTRSGMEVAVRGDADGDGDGAAPACEIVGVGRPACLNPTLPRDVVFNTAEVKDTDAVLATTDKIPVPFLIKLLGLAQVIGAGIESTWYGTQLQKIGKK